MKKILYFMIALMMLFANFAYASVVDENGKVITLTKTTSGYISLDDGLKANIDNLKKHTVIVKLMEEDVQYRAAGIAIDKRHILTVNHITSDTGKNFYRSTDGGINYWATIVKQDPTHDITLLEIDKTAPDLIAEPMSFASGVTDGEAIFTIGHPENLYDLTTGTVESKAKGWNDIEGYMLNASLRQGNSGGFVINKNGEIVGMAFCDGGMLKNIGYMIGEEDIQNFIK